MVIKGSPRGGPAGLAKHLARTDTNERMEVKELRGVAAIDLGTALQEMDAYGAALRTTRTLYHASINTRADEHLTDAQRTHAIDQLEAKLGLTGQPRAVVEHEKEGRAHWHIVWSRTDLEHMRAIRCDHNYRKHEEVARALEREFGHAHVQGAHTGREGKDGERVARPERTPSHAEMQQAARSGLTPRQAKAQITELWQRTDSGKAFAAALDEAGWILVQGDRRDFALIDRAGEVHSLARRIEGAKAKDVCERLADIDLASLPTVEQAKATQRDRTREAKQPAKEPTKQVAPAKEAKAAPVREVRPVARTDDQPQQARPAPAPQIPLAPVRSAGKELAHTASTAATKGNRVASGLMGGLAKLADSLLSVFEAKQAKTPEELATEAKAEQERHAAAQETKKTFDRARFMEEQRAQSAALEREDEARKRYEETRKRDYGGRERER